MADNLKPCPFCGAQPGALDASQFVVECPSCGICGPARDDESQAIAAWNMRADTAPTDLGAQALEVLRNLVRMSDDGYSLETIGSMLEMGKPSAREIVEQWEKGNG